MLGLFRFTEYKVPCLVKGRESCEEWCCVVKERMNKTVNC